MRHGHIQLHLEAGMVVQHRNEGLNEELRS